MWKWSSDDRREMTEAPDTTEEQPAEEAPAEVATEDAGTPAAPAEPAEQLSPKQRRARERSQHTGETRPARTPEERQQERDARRKHNAEQRRRWRARQKANRTPSGETPPPVERAKAAPRVRQGVVVSDKADKTITVRIDSQRAHRTYGKIIRSSSTLHAHDEQNDANAGDTVRVVESRPLSRTKRWRLVEVVERAR